MLTPRGWWLVVLTAVVTLVGVLAADRVPPTLPLLGLSLVAFLFVEFWLFAGRARSARTQLRVVRSVLQSGRAVNSVWAGVPCKVRVEVFGGPAKVVLAFAADKLPPGIEAENRAAGPLSAEVPLIIAYDAVPPGPGVLRFEGVEVKLTDFAGLFAVRLFHRQRVEFPVLPQVVPTETGLRAFKRVNALPPPGAHRMRRPGGGAELLELRDYRPGDPPKMIAWKTSARRDKLIVKEYETDVPVREVLFLDASDSVRVGPPGESAVCRLSAVAAALSQDAIDRRDLVGLTVFDDRGQTRTAPARGPIHAVKLLAELAAAAARPAAPGRWTFAAARKAALPVAQEFYPDLLAADVNATPRAMHWRPVLDTRWGWLLLVPMGLTPVLAVQPFWIDAAASFAKSVRPKGGGVWIELPFFLLALGVVLSLPSVLAGLLWLWLGLRGFWDAAATRQRKQLGALFAALDGDTPAAVERYLKDDGEFARRAAVFLADHGGAPETDPPAHRTAAKVEQLADALVRAVAHARDNETYVILADLVPAADDLEPLVKAVRAVRGRHHAVRVVLPWPADVPDPNAPVPPPEKLRIAQMVQAGLVRQYLRRYHKLRGDLARLGVTVVRCGPKDAVPQVLNRLHGRRRAGA